MIESILLGTGALVWAIILTCIALTIGGALIYFVAGFMEICRGKN